jgi:hypothetical protein
MAITDPRVVLFANNNVRRFDDLLYSAYMTAKSLIAIWNAQGLSALTPNTSAIVEDGASVNGADATGGDGRPLMHGTDINNAITRATDLVNWMEGSVGVSTNDGTKGVLNTIAGVKVNGAALF